MLASAGSDSSASGIQSAVHSRHWPIARVRGLPVPVWSHGAPDHAEKLGADPVLHHPKAEVIIAPREAEPVPTISYRPTPRIKRKRADQEVNRILEAQIVKHGRQIRTSRVIWAKEGS